MSHPFLVFLAGYAVGGLCMLAVVLLLHGAAEVSHEDLQKLADEM